METTRACGASHSVTVAELDLTGGMESAHRLGDNNARYDSSGEDSGCSDEEGPKAKRAKKEQKKEPKERSNEIDLVKLRHADRAKDGRKKKKQKKRHISYTHALHRPKKTSTVESRLTTKRKVRRQAKRAKH